MSAPDDRALVARQPAWVQRAMERRGDYEDAIAVPRLALWWPRLTAWWQDAEATPDDGHMAADSLRRVGLYAPQRWWLLASWLQWGVACPQPAMGALAVIRRRDRAFIGWVAGADDRSRLVVVTAVSGCRVILLPRIAMMHVQCMRWPAEREAQMDGFAMRWAQEGT